MGTTKSMDTMCFYFLINIDTECKENIRNQSDYQRTKIEMNLLSIAHNLQKIYRMKKENKVMRRESSQCKTYFENLFA